MNPADLDRLRAALADRYQIENEIGHGGMAVVYSARDVRHERQVAVKVVYPELAHAVGGQRFLREIAIAARLQHPNILTLIDSGEAGGFLYYVMPFVDGETLRSRIARDGALPVSEAIRAFREIVDAVAYAHKAGMVHRDLKPDNVMLANRHALILDFGVAKAVNDSTTRHNLTTAGASLGTPAYMAPEQVAADPAADHRADIYSAGVVAYEMLTGEPPFKGSGQQIMSAHVVTKPRRPSELNPLVTPQVERIVMRCLEKEPGNRYQSADLLLDDLDALITPAASSTSPVLKQSAWTGGRIAATIAVVILALAAIGYPVISRSRKDRWVREDGIPAILKYVEAGANDSALLVAREVVKTGRGDSLLAPLWPKFTRKIVFRTEPAGAKVYSAVFNNPHDWQLVGTTPTDTVRMPASPSTMRIRISKPGYITVNRLIPAFAQTPIVLDSATPENEKMARIPGGNFLGALPGLDNLPPIPLGDYRIALHEATNREYKKFVDAGGYAHREFWTEPFEDNGKTLTYEQAIARFLDKTGRPGPASWEAGDIPSGQEDLPVGGISWYEANAFAKFSGMSLPTVFHWARAATVGSSAYVVPGSNFSGQGLTRGSTTTGMSGFGVFDLAGNVREWCYNANGPSKYILGGGFSDPSWMFNDSYTQRPFDRSVINGVRLMQTIGAEENMALATREILRSYRDYSKESPVSDAAFHSFLQLYEYDRTPLLPKVERKGAIETFATEEKVSFNAAYGNERVTAYLYLPTAGKPPFQTIVYFPGSNAIHTPIADGNLEISRMNFLLKSGRAVIYPIYKGTYERGDSLKSDYGDMSIFYRDHVVMWAKDLRRSVDYLATRPEIDTTKLAYFGASWGATLGPIMIAVEPRIKAGILYIAGMPMEHQRPEADQINFMPRVKIPIIMLNGKYDHFFPTETSQKPFFRLLGSPPADKKYILYEGGHFVPRTQLIAESLSWLDRYLGPVRR